MAITKLARSTERANHHIELHTTTLEKKKPLRGLIPKIHHKVSDTPANIIIKWEGIKQKQPFNSLQHSGTTGERAHRLQEELVP